MFSFELHSWSSSPPSSSPLLPRLHSDQFYLLSHELVILIVCLFISPYRRLIFFIIFIVFILLILVLHLFIIFFVFKSSSSSLKLKLQSNHFYSALRTSMASALTARKPRLLKPLVTISRPQSPVGITAKKTLADMCNSCAGCAQSLLLRRACSAPYTPSTSTGCGEDTSLQYRWCTTGLLQLNPIRNTNVFEAATHAKIIRSSRSPAAKKITCWTTSLYRSLAACPTADFDYADVQDTSYVNVELSKPSDFSTYSGTRMLLRLVPRTLLAVLSTRTALASQAFSVCTPVVWNSLPESVQ